MYSPKMPTGLSPLPLRAPGMVQDLQPGWGFLQPQSPAQARVTPLIWAGSSCGDAAASPFQGMQEDTFSMQGEMHGENITLRNGSVPSKCESQGGSPSAHSTSVLSLLS